MRLSKHTFAVFVMCLLCIWPLHASAEDTLKARIDSMFLIASSGDFKFRELVQPTMEDIAAIGVTAVPYLIDRLGTEDARERVTLRQIFQKIGPPAVPLLNDALLETDSLQLSRVALILYYLPDSSSVDNLLKVADNEYYWARYQVVRALGKIGDIKARPAIEKAVNDDIELVRTMAAVAAGRINPVQFFPLLNNALQDSYYGVRMAAIDEIAKLNCQDKTRLILPALSLISSDLSRNLLLSVIAADSCVYDLDILQPILEGTGPVAQSLALKTIAKSDDEKTIADYIEKLQDTDNQLLRQTIEELIQTDETKKTSTNP